MCTAATSGRQRIVYSLVSCSLHDHVWYGTAYRSHATDDRGVADGERQTDCESIKSFRIPLCETLRHRCAVIVGDVDAIRLEDFVN